MCLSPADSRRQAVASPNTVAVALLLAGRVFKHYEVILLEQVFDLNGFREAARGDFLLDNFLTGANVTHHPFRAFAWNANKVDHNNASAWFESLADRVHHSHGEFEVMVGVTDENDISGSLWQFD